MNNISTAIQQLRISFRKPQQQAMEQSPLQIQHNLSAEQQPTSTTIDSLQTLVQPITQITSIIKARTHQHPSELQEAPEFCPSVFQIECNSPARKTFKQNHDVPLMQQETEMLSQEMGN